MEKKKKAGRPKKYNIDTKQITKLASYGCTNIEIASFFGCEETHIRKNYSEFLTKGREQGKIRLRQMQWKSAEGQETIMENGKVIKQGVLPNVTMQIWLGKQILGQSDKTEYTWDNPIEEIEFIDV